jgi:hypothetical protein
MGGELLKILTKIGRLAGLILSKNTRKLEKFGELADNIKIFSNSGKFPQIFRNSAAARRTVGELREVGGWSAKISNIWELFPNISRIGRRLIELTANRGRSAEISKFRRNFPKFSEIRWRRLTKSTVTW